MVVLYGGVGGVVWWCCMVVLYGGVVWVVVNRFFNASTFDILNALDGVFSWF